MKPTLEVVVQRFLAIGSDLMFDTDSLTRDRVARLIDFYRGAKIAETVPKSPDDILELSYREDHPVETDEPLDARQLGDGDYEFSDQPELCLAIERRVFPSLMKGADPDDHNVAMRVYFSFGASPGDVKGYTTEIEDLEIDAANYKAFLDHPSVAKLLMKKPIRVSVVVEGCG